MRNQSIVSYKQRLDNLFAQIKGVAGDPELQSHWAMYLCVLTSGFLETSVRQIYGLYASNKAAPNVANFVKDKLEGFQNPNMEKILELTRSFSQEWETRLRAATEGEIKDDVDSIVANRHNIAHGRSVGITYIRMKNYYDNALKLIDLIDEQCQR